MTGSLSEPSERGSSAPQARIETSKGPLEDEPFEPEVLESTLGYIGKVWNVREESFRYGDGVLRRHFMDHPGAVAVLALDDEDRVCLIQQYRHPVRLRDWELPAGLLDVAGESPLIGAQRELAEEVDLTATEWSLLLDFANSPGGSNEVIRIYLARGLGRTATAFARTAEEADMLVRWVALDELVEAVRSGRVQNAATVVAALSAAFERDRGWSGLRDPEAPWDRHPSQR
jgi:ADP-ribose pyrophosphatase